MNVLECVTLKLHRCARTEFLDELGPPDPRSLSTMSFGPAPFVRATRSRIIHWRRKMSMFGTRRFSGSVVVMVMVVPFIKAPVLTIFVASIWHAPHSQVVSRRKFRFLRHVHNGRSHHNPSFRSLHHLITIIRIELGSRFHRLSG